MSTQNKVTQGEWVYSPSRSEIVEFPANRSARQIAAMIPRCFPTDAEKHRYGELLASAPALAVRVRELEADNARQTAEIKALREALVYARPIVSAYSKSERSSKDQRRASAEILAGIDAVLGTEG